MKINYESTSAERMYDEFFKELIIQARLKLQEILKDNKQNGIILYGVNGVGKSVFLKSIGLNTILAQSGNYVSCKSFKFSPFTKILTRILGNDNIFTHSSSFQIQLDLYVSYYPTYTYMHNLPIILKRM